MLWLRLRHLFLSSLWYVIALAVGVFVTLKYGEVPFTMGTYAFGDTLLFFIGVVVTKWLLDLNLLIQIPEQVAVRLLVIGCLLAAGPWFLEAGINADFFPSPEIAKERQAIWDTPIPERHTILDTPIHDVPAPYVSSRKAGAYTLTTGITAKLLSGDEHLQYFSAGDLLCVSEVMTIGLAFTRPESPGSLFLGTPDDVYAPTFRRNNECGLKSTEPWPDTYLPRVPPPGARGSSSRQHAVHPTLHYRAVVGQ